MKEEKKKRKLLVSIIIIGIVLVIVIGIGISYALWTYTANQSTVNKIESDCLKLELTDVTDAINLEKAYPITRGDAQDLEEYKFTVKNLCNTWVSYEVDLEIMDVTNRLSSEYIAVSLNGETNDLLSNKEEVDPTYTEDDYTAVEARKLGIGSLEAKESKELTLKLWMDESVTSTDAMNKSFVSKINVTGEILTNPTLSDIVKLGDYVSMTPTSTSFDITNDLTGFWNDFNINPSELNLWRVIRVNNDGTIDMVSEHVSANYNSNGNSYGIAFYTLESYQKVVQSLNTIAAQYENTKYTVGSRHMGYDGQIEYITDTSRITPNIPWTCSTDDEGCKTVEAQGGGDKFYKTDVELVQNALGTLEATDLSGTVRGYFLASRNYAYYNNSSELVQFDVRGVSNTGVVNNAEILYGCTLGKSCSNYGYNNAGIRPIVTIKSGLNVPGDGSSDSPWTLA